MTREQEGKESGVGEEAEEEEEEEEEEEKAQASEGGRSIMLEVVRSP